MSEFGPSQSSSSASEGQGSPNPEGQNEAPAEISAKDALIQSLGRDFSSYTHDGNFCVYIKFVRNRDDIEKDIRDDCYFPDFVHQFFIESERIFGYKQPIIRLYYTASRLKRYVKFDYEDSLTRDKDGIDADDVFSYLSPILDGIEYTQDVQQFIQETTCKEELEFRPPGELLQEFESVYRKRRHLSRAHRELLEEAGELNLRLAQNGAASIINGLSSTSQNGQTKSALGSSTSTQGHSVDPATPERRKRYQIYHANSSTKSFNQFQARMQTLVMWFIESANMIEFEDSRWDWFMIFERFNPAPSELGAHGVSTEDRYYFAGYATVYRYYAYPDRMRPRVSQMLILPQYRRNGLGTTLLQSIYDFYKKLPATLDITAEDPDEEFIAMRDLLDCKNCLGLDTFKTEKLREGWSDEMAQEAQEKLKLCRRQSRKVYEILKMRVTNRADEDDYRNYRLEIKNRLNIPNRRQRLDVSRAIKRYRNIEVPDELKPQEKVIAAKLEDNFRLLEKQYDHVVQKLNHPTIAAA